MKVSIQEWVEKYWKLIVIILGGTVLIMRLLDESRLMWIFPFDFTNDLSAYMAQLHFLKVCGFHGYCPYWYNGFIHLLITSPGWYFFAYPLYMLFGDVKIATYVSMVALFSIAGLVSLYVGKKISITKVSSIALFILFFANASVIGNVIRNGRQHVMLSLILLALLFSVIWHFKEKKLNAFFFLTSVVYGAMLITHYQETVLAALLFACLFLYKKEIKERAMIAGSFILSFMLTSWWVTGFLKNLRASSLLTFYEGKRVFEFTKETVLTNIIAFIIPILLIVLIYFYLKRDETPKREKMFFIPIAAFALLYTLRITTILPVLRNISQDPYMMFFLFFIVIIFFKEERWIMQGVRRKIIPWCVIMMIILSGVVSMAYTPWFVKNTPLEERIIGMYSAVKDRFIIVGPLNTTEYRTLYSKPLYAYASIYHNLSTSDGWSPPLASSEYLARLNTFGKQSDTLGCEEFSEELLFFNTANVISIEPQCSKFKQCGFHEIKKNEEVCLYEIDKFNVSAHEKQVSRPDV